MRLPLLIGLFGLAACTQTVTNGQVTSTNVDLPGYMAPPATENGSAQPGMPVRGQMIRPLPGGSGVQIGGAPRMPWGQPPAAQPNLAAPPANLTQPAGDSE